MLRILNNDELTGIGKVDRETKEEIKKPTCAVNYNANMGLVAKIVMLLNSVECLRKTIKWYKKLFSYLLICLSSTDKLKYSLYKINSGKHTTLADFQLEIIRQMKKYVKLQNT